jgi:hypothetical protein
MRASSSRAVFDLGHMARLSYDPGLVLVVSERTSYILHNLAIADIGDSNRYAIYPPFDGRYQPVLPSDGPEYGVFEQIVRDFERDILEVGTVPIQFIASVASESFSGTADAANIYKYGAYVPDDECWEVEAWWQLASTAVSMFQVTMSGNQNTYLDNKISPAAAVEWVGGRRVTIGPGTRIFMAWNGCTPNVTTYAGGYNYRVLPLVA